MKRFGLVLLLTAGLYVMPGTIAFAQRPAGDLLRQWDDLDAEFPVGLRILALEGGGQRGGVDVELLDAVAIFESLHVAYNTTTLHLHGIEQLLHRLQRTGELFPIAREAEADVAFAVRPEHLSSQNPERSEHCPPAAW